MFRRKEEEQTAGSEAIQPKSPGQLTKKEKSILKTYEEPVLPIFCRILFIGQFILAAAMLAVDLNAFLRYDRNLGWKHLFGNLCMTGFWFWLCAALVILPVCLSAIWFARRRFYRQREKSGITDETEEDRKRTRRALQKLTADYRKYIKISAVGLLIWAFLYALSAILR